jgi:hypothetical protein
VAEECRKHSRVALQVLEDTLLNEVIEPLLRRLAMMSGLGSVRELLERYERSPDELSVDKLLAALNKSGRHRLVLTAISPLLGWVKRRGGVEYEEAVRFAKECGLEKTYKLLVAYPKIGAKLVELLNSLAGVGRVERAREGK